MYISELSRDDNSYHADIDIWGDSTPILVCVKRDTPDSDDTAKKVLAVIERAAAVLHEKRADIEQALIDDGMIDNAEDWASSAEEAEDEDRECYIMEDGTKVFLPISEEDFKASLHANSVLIYVDENFEYEDFEFFIDCRPDYFACHSIEVYVYSDGSLKVAGIAG